MKTKKSYQWVYTLSIYLLLLLFSSCMQTNVVVKYDNDNPVATKVTKWNFLWGALQSRDVKVEDTCESICMVKMKNNIGQIMLSAVTLGAVVPMSMEYRCCPYEPAPGDL